MYLIQIGPECGERRWVTGVDEGGGRALCCQLRELAGEYSRDIMEMGDKEKTSWGCLVQHIAAYRTEYTNRIYEHILLFGSEYMEQSISNK